MFKKLGILILPVLLFTSVYAQDEPVKPEPKNRVTAYKKGTFYAFWGWNRATYTYSDVHFKGNDYNFTLYDVKASDRPTSFSFKEYLRPDRITIPQTNFRIGYFIKDNLAITLAVDHMKYVMMQGQTVTIDGFVKPAYASHLNDDGSVKLTEQFLTYEHTDGLNYINSEIEYYRNLYQYKFLKVNALVGAGGGFLLPKSNVQLMDNERHDDFHLAGFGLSAKGGLDVNLWNLFFLRTELKPGYINMPSIRTTQHKSDKARQVFWFLEWTYVFGFSWHF